MSDEAGLEATRESIDWGGSFERMKAERDKWRAENRRSYQLQEGQAEQIRGLREKLASRDVLIESQARQIAALTGSIQDINTGWDETLGQLAALDAVIERIAEATDVRNGSKSERLLQIAMLTTEAPVSVLAEHDARVLEEATLVQHLWNEGKPFCADESVRPWCPADREESLARPVCALCHKRAMKYARTAIRAASEQEPPLIECTHWQAGRTTLRHNCTACASDPEGSAE